VVIATEKPDHKLLVDIVNQCADEKVRVKIEPDLYDVFAGQTKTYYLYGLPLIEVSTQLLKPWQETIKRIFDFTFSFLVLFAGLPFWVLIALGVKIDSRGPIFYTQKRVGKDGKIFEIYKFRSMVYQPERKDQTWTTTNDPRVTRFGRFIRKTHLDEIPQFLNVLLGHMSIVGPRPEQPKFVDDFAIDFPHYKRRLKVRPGITGWHQVTSYGYELSAEEIRDRLRNDFHYIENMSLKLDIEIIVRTLWCMIMGRGQA
jgi:exopolysaccharide biosynthesis polyprenyl glycosylphosphotransferase